MIKFMDGFDQYQGGEGTTAPAVLMAAAGYTCSGNIRAAVGRRTDTKAVAISAGSVAKTISTGSTKVVFGWAYKATAKRATIATISGVGDITWRTTDGKVSIAGGTGTATILLGLWYYFEVVIDKTAGSVQLWVNNERDVEAALPGAVTSLASYTITWASPDLDTKYIDDFIVIDGTTGTNIDHVDRVGPIQITARLPSVDYLKEWSPSAGDDHYALVDNQPPSATQYIQSNTSGAQDLFQATSGLPETTDIIAVGVVAYNHKSDIDARQLGLAVGAKGADQLQVVDAALTTADKYSFAVFERGPGGVEWSDSLVGDTPFGVVVRP